MQMKPAGPPSPDLPVNFGSPGAAELEGDGRCFSEKVGLVVSLVTVAGRKDKVHPQHGGLSINAHGYRKLRQSPRKRGLGERRLDRQGRNQSESKTTVWRV